MGLGCGPADSRVKNVARGVAAVHGPDGVSCLLSLARRDAPSAARTHTH